MRKKMAGDLAQTKPGEYPSGGPFVQQQADTTIAYHLRSQQDAGPEKEDATEECVKGSASPTETPQEHAESHLTTPVQIKPTRTRLPDDVPGSTLSSSKPQFHSLLIKRTQPADGPAATEKRQLLSQKLQRSAIPSRPRLALLPITRQQNQTHGHAEEPATKKRQRPPVSAISPAEPSQKAKKRRTQK
jgi:hypothetical protein